MRVAVLSRIWPGALETLRARHDCAEALDPSPERKRDVLRRAQVVVLRSPVVLDRGALEGAPELELIVRAGTGLDSIDTEFAAQRGIQIVIVPHSARSVAEHTFGLILALRRHIPKLDRSLRDGRWEKHEGAGRELSGSVLGLLGFGRIGRCTAEIGAALGMHCIACDRSPDKPAKQEAAHRLGVDFLPLEALLPETDVLSVQIPLTPESRGLLDVNRIALLRSDAILVNVGRGAVVDERALHDALRRGRLAGAASDVFTTEPPGRNPLFELDNFVGTPHVGAQTEDAQRKIGARVVEAIEAFSGRRSTPSPKEEVP